VTATRTRERKKQKPVQLDEEEMEKKPWGVPVQKFFGGGKSSRGAIDVSWSYHKLRRRTMGEGRQQEHERRIATIRSGEGATRPWFLGFVQSKKRIKSLPVGRVGADVGNAGLTRVACPDRSAWPGLVRHNVQQR